MRVSRQDIPDVSKQIPVQTSGTDYQRLILKHRHTSHRRPTVEVHDQLPMIIIVRRCSAAARREGWSNKKIADMENLMFWFWGRDRTFFWSTLCGVFRVVRSGRDEQ